jgi:putative membrane protein (TIGR04086 family)
MLAALNFAAVGFGVGAGGLSATVAALVISALLSLLGVDEGPDIGLFSGVIIGLAVAGWVAGRMARHSERFHGAVTGLLLAGLVVVLARLGGSPASTASVLWLALLSAVVSGAAGWWAGVRKQTAR